MKTRSSIKNILKQLDCVYSLVGKTIADLPIDRLMTLWTDYELHQLENAEIVNKKVEDLARANLICAGLDPLLIDKKKERLEKDFDKNTNEVKDSLSKLGIDYNSIDVKKYIKRTLKEDSRNNIEPESIKESIFNSGYIDIKGRFYGCGDTHHRLFAEELKEQGLIETNDDLQIWIESNGWIKLSMGRLYFFSTSQYNKPTTDQVDTILDYCDRRNGDGEKFIMYNDKKYDFKQIFEVLEKENTK